MVGRERWFDEPRRRWALIGGAVLVVVVAVVVGVVSIGHDSDSADSPPQTVAETAPPVAAPPGNAGEDRSGSHADRDRRADQKSNEHDQNTGGHADKTSNGARQPSDSADDEPQSCPPTLSDAQCAALADLVAQGGGGPAVKEGECPPGLSQAQCGELAQMIEQAEVGTPVKQGECPPGLTQEQCEALR